jgi:hypothetical protein
MKIDNDQMLRNEMAVEGLIVKKMPEIVLGSRPSTKWFLRNTKLGRC